jgi:hypothetical protein
VSRSLSAMSRRDALLLRAFAGWTIFIWATRILNILRDGDPDHGFGFKAVHVVLAAVSVAFAVAAIGAVGRSRRRAAVGSDA